MKHKRILALILALVLALGLCACGQSGENIEDTPAAQDSGEDASVWEEEGDAFYEEYVSEEEEYIPVWLSTEEELYSSGSTPLMIKEIMYNQQKRLELYMMPPMVLDLTAEGSIKDITENADGVSGFTAVLPDGREIPFAAQGISFDSDGSMIIAPLGYICSLREIEGLFGLNITAKPAEDGTFPWLVLCGGVCAGNDTEVSDPGRLYYVSGVSMGIDYENDYMLENLSGFGFFKLFNDMDEGSVRIEKIDIRASGEHHGIGRVELNPDFYGRPCEGSCYDTSREGYNADEGTFDFYLLLVSDILGDMPPFASASVYGTPNFTVGELRDSEGNIKPKTEPLACGDTIEVELDGVVYDAQIPVSGRYYPENYYEASPTTVIKAQGDVNVLVVPVYFPEQRDFLDENTEIILSALGSSVIIGTGEHHEQSDDCISLSEYYFRASYGKLNLTSYITDWYEITDGSYEDWIDSDHPEYREMALQTWVNENYSDMNGQLDADSDGIYDAVIIVCASSFESREAYNIISYGGAYNHTRAWGYFYSRGGETAINGYVNISTDMLLKNMGESASGTDAGTLIHEFGHGLGLIDYYDVTYHGYNALGGYDMQSDNHGDWNAYSKYAVGWTQPRVLTAAEIGSGITLTIGSFAETGDTLIIPTENYPGGAFCEYIMIDLFTPTGLYEDGSAQYGLNKPGVRIYHVDAALCAIDVEEDWGWAGLTYDTVNTNAYTENGRYHIQLLQKGGVNSFTAGEYRPVCADDLFDRGDSFRIADYGQVFANGAMNDGSAFPYEIRVISVGENSAEIEIVPVNG